MSNLFLQIGISIVKVADLIHFKPLQIDHLNPELNPYWFYVC
jgi:hypothetical protein